MSQEQEYPIKCITPGWEHMQFREVTHSSDDWANAHPSHRFFDEKGNRWLIARVCSGCPHEVEE